MGTQHRDSMALYFQNILFVTENNLCFHLPGQGGVTWQLWQVEKNIRVLINAFLFSFASHGNNIHIKWWPLSQSIWIYSTNLSHITQKFHNPCISWRSSLLDQVLKINFKCITQNIVVDTFKHLKLSKLDTLAFCSRSSVWSNYWISNI